MDINPPPPQQPNRPQPQDARTDLSDAPRRKPSVTAAQKKLAAILTLALVASLIANFINDSRFADTGIYFVLLPGSMAIVLSLLPTTGPRTGISAFHGTMIAILASAILVREGLICVIMASPLIFLVVYIGVWTVKPSRNGRNAGLLLPLLLVGASGEGIVYALPTNVTVTETRTVDIESDQLLASLAEPAVLPEIEPLLFALPFPQPQSFEGEGLEVGAARVVDFGDGGTIDLTISDVTDNSVTWAFVDNTTPLDDWMTIHEATASWIETPDGLELTVAIEFDRELAPAFYFDPLERWGVGEFAEVLLDMVEYNAVEHSAELASEAAQPTGAGSA